MRVALIVITIVVLAVTGAALALGWEGAFTRRRDPVTVDAYVAGDRTPLVRICPGMSAASSCATTSRCAPATRSCRWSTTTYRAMAAEAEAARAALAARGEKREVLQEQVLQAQDNEGPEPAAAGGGRVRADRSSNLELGP